MHYQLYLPGQTGQDPALLDRAGLPGFGAGANFIDLVENGPDGGRGLVVAWPNPRQPQLGYLPDQQTWIPAAPRQDLGARGQGSGNAPYYYVGFWNESPPTPAELAYRQPLESTAVVLGDGEAWNIPAAGRLPRTFRLDPRDGRPTLHVKTQFADFFVESQKYYAAIVSADAESGLLSVSELWWTYLVWALQLNYRITPEVVSELGLLDTQNAVDAIMASLQGLQIRTVEADQKKTAVPASIPAG